MSGSPASAGRPTVGAGADQQAAADAVAALIAELQDGIDRRDADIYNRHFAADVAWGSPFGATVFGYERLHAIHQRLHRQAGGGPAARSRYQVTNVLPVTDDVIVAHVARVALDPGGQPVGPTPDTSGAFSEMALYVLVRRDGAWWLAAGQNTPIRPGGAVPATLPPPGS